MPILFSEDMIAARFRTPMRFLFFIFLCTEIAGLRAAPLALHSDNPHYLLWRGKPEVIITSGEHYGAVLNLGFDYRRYLDRLAKNRLTNRA